MSKNFLIWHLAFGKDDAKNGHLAVGGSSQNPNLCISGILISIELKSNAGKHFEMKRDALKFCTGR